MDKLFLTKCFHCKGAVIYGWMNPVRRSQDHMLRMIAVGAGNLVGAGAGDWLHDGSFYSYRAGHRNY